MKEKPNSTRTYDEDGFRRRAACLCLRHDGDETEILLVSSSSSPDRFIVPGGGLEPEEDAAAAAIREVMEEAGVRGTLGACLGVFENLERRNRTQVFILQVAELLDEWDDSKSMGRRRKWFTLSSALEELTISKPVQCTYVRLFANLQKQQQQELLSPTVCSSGHRLITDSGDAQGPTATADVLSGTLASNVSRDASSSALDTAGSHSCASVSSSGPSVESSTAAACVKPT